LSGISLKSKNENLSSYNWKTIQTQQRLIVTELNISASHQNKALRKLQLLYPTMLRTRCSSTRTWVQGRKCRTFGFVGIY